MATPLTTHATILCIFVLVVITIEEPMPLTGFAYGTADRKKEPTFIPSRCRKPLRSGPVLKERESGCAFLKKTQIARTLYSVD